MSFASGIRKLIDAVQRKPPSRFDHPQTYDYGGNAVARVRQQTSGAMSTKLATSGRDQAIYRNGEGNGAPRRFPKTATLGCFRECSDHWLPSTARDACPRQRHSVIGRKRSFTILRSRCRDQISSVFFGMARVRDGDARNEASLRQSLVRIRGRASIPRGDCVSLPWHGYQFSKERHRSSGSKSIRTNFCASR